MPPVSPAAPPVPPVFVPPLAPAAPPVPGLELPGGVKHSPASEQLGVTPSISQPLNIEALAAPSETIADVAHCLARFISLLAA
jgi:hypothetical protein